MESTVRATCPQCRAALRIPAKWVGQAVKCKKCGATVRVKAPEEGPAPDDTAPHTPLPAGAPAPAANPFAFDEQPAEDDGDFLGLSQPAPAPVLDANGYPLPPAGYALPPGYPAPVPGAAGYPYAPPPGYPYPLPPGYAPPPGYPAPGAPAPGAAYPYPTPGYALPPGYAPPPGYPYPQPAPAAAPLPAPVPAAAAPAPATPMHKPGAKPATAKAPARPGAKSAAPTPRNEFELGPATTGAAARRGARGRRPQRGGSNKFIWIGFCVLLTAGLVAGGVYGSKFLKSNFGGHKKDDAEAKGDAPPRDVKAAVQKPGSTAFPRRLLFVSVSKYMYLNPLTASRDGIDLAKPAALRMAYDWRVPTDKDNNQLFVLADTLMGPEARLPMKSVVQGAYQEFFKTTRAQDRIAVYFGGHAVEKDGKAYIAPMEAEVEGEEWQKSMIPLDQFYGELAKCKAAQKVVIWDVCRFNPEKGRVRPGSEPMTEGLHKALSSPPPGVQAVVTCKAGENALEFTSLRPDGGFSGPVYSGSAFLDSMKFVGEAKNNRLPKTTPTAADPIPVPEWMAATAKRAGELSALAEKAGVGKQSIAVAGAPPASLPPPNPEEKAASRFEMPHPPPGASVAEIKSVEREFLLPPLKPGLGGLALGDFPFPADVMKPYENDGVSLDEVTKNPEKHPFRFAVLDTLNKLRDKWSQGAGKTQLRESVEGPINDKLKAAVKKEQDDWVVDIIELELNLTALENVKEMRDAQPKRWQAHYDFALASLKARLAYMNEYNKVLGLLITEALPPLDQKLGQDGYVLVASETLRSSKDIKKTAEEAQELFQEITEKYRGTPWAIQAKQEKSVVLGLNWKPASLKKAE